MFLREELWTGRRAAHDVRAVDVPLIQPPCLRWSVQSPMSLDSRECSRIAILSSSRAYSSECSVRPRLVTISAHRIR